MAAKFKINKTKTGFTFWLVASNGETIATSEVYTRLANCEKGIASVKKNAPIAAIEDQTEKGFKPIRSPKFEIYLDKKGAPRFRMKAANGQTVISSEPYTSVKAALGGVKSVIKNAGAASEKTF